MPKRLRRTLLAVAAVLPGLIAAAVAYFYVVGAVTAYAQFNDAEVSPELAMPLVPIEQLLGKGIGALAGTALALVFGWVVMLWYSPDSPDPPGRTEAQAKKALSWIFGILIVAIGVFSSPAGFLPLGLTIAVAAGMLVQIRYWNLRYFTSLIIFGIVVQGTLALSEAWLRPEPLPTASVQVTHGQGVEGSLITSNDGTWYLVNDTENEDAENGHPYGVTGIPASKIKSVDVEQDERDDPPSLFNAIF